MSHPNNLHISHTIRQHYVATYRVSSGTVGLPFPNLKTIREFNTFFEDWKKKHPNTTNGFSIGLAYDDFKKEKPDFEEKEVLSHVEGVQL